MLGPRRQQCLALLAVTLLIAAASAKDIQTAAQKDKAQKTALKKDKSPDTVNATPFTAAVPQTCLTKSPNSCICSAGSCSGCDACAGCEDRMCVAAPAGYAPIIAQSVYQPTVAIAELPPQLLSEMKAPKPQHSNHRGLLQSNFTSESLQTDQDDAAEPVQTDRDDVAALLASDPELVPADTDTVETEADSPSAAAAAASSLVCDGEVHEIVIPAAPYPEQTPYNNPYNNPPGIRCSRAVDGTCGAQASVDCDDGFEAVGRNRTGNVIKDIGPVSQNGDGTFVISPLNPLVFTLDPLLNQYLTYAEWMVYDVGPGGAKLVGNYAAGGGMQPDVNSYNWVPNGKQVAPDGTQYCEACTSCKPGEGVTNMTLLSKPGTGYSSLEVSQLYTDASCGATCANLDGLFWTGMKYKCVMPTCHDTDLSQLGNQNFVCPRGYVFNRGAAANTTLDKDTCCMFAPTCGNTDPVVPDKSYPCSAQGCLSPPFEDECWTNNVISQNIPLTGDTAMDLLTCCDQPTRKTSAGDVYVTKVADAPVQQVVDSTFQFTIQVGVNGLADAMVEDAVLTDTLPAGLVLDSLTEDPFENACATISQTQFRCKWGYILKGQIKKITLKVAAETAGEFTNIARVKSPNDTNPDNNEDRDRVRALGACCDRAVPQCSNSLPADCKGPKTFTQSKACSAINCVPLSQEEGSCCLPSFGQCVDRTKAASCQDAGGRWTAGKLCSQTPNCKPPQGACCNVKTGACTVNQTLTQCELEVCTWKKDGTCSSDGYCSGSCCDTNSGNCFQAMKKDCMRATSVWSIYQQCNILTCPKANQCIPSWWQCKPPLYGQQDPCCPGYSCQHAYKKCKAGEWVCKPKTPVEPEQSCVPEFHSCGGYSNGVCCGGLYCKWDHKHYKGVCKKYHQDKCQRDGGKCKHDDQCLRGSRCAFGRCKPCARDSCYRECFDFKCFEERKKDCSIFYSTAASL